MCGIIAACAPHDVVPILQEGLLQLEYRGYDSAGIAVANGDKIELAKVVGRVQRLVRPCRAFNARIGVGHTRWATHGPSTLANAHPHRVGNVALVHNGQLANDIELRNELGHAGIKVNGETDSEVAAHHFALALRERRDPLTALRATTAKLEGTYALVALVAGANPCLLITRQDTPVVLAWGKSGSLYAASDVMAFPDDVREVAHLRNGQHAMLSAKGCVVTDVNGCRQPAKKAVCARIERGDKKGHRHYMHKEIHEQPAAVAATLASLVRQGNRLRRSGLGKGMASVLARARGIRILACGTSLNAARVAQGWARELGCLPVAAEVASEYVPDASVGEELVLALSQSGETADTLRALRRAREAGAMKLAALVNVPSSTLAQEVDIVMHTKAGLEIGVASTKSFTCQLAVLRALVLQAAQVGGKLDEKELRHEVQDLGRVAGDLNVALGAEVQVKKLVRWFGSTSSALFVGRGVMHAIALEAALKLTEISYIHASAFPAGELKHGPLALVDENMPVVALVQDDRASEKMVVTNYEITARGGKVITFACGSYVGKGESVSVPTTSAVGQVFATVALTQMLAYHVALARGTDVDKPRNLAKSVTVE